MIFFTFQQPHGLRATPCYKGIVISSGRKVVMK